MIIGCAYDTECVNWPKFQWLVDALLSMGHEIRVIRTFEELKAQDQACDLILFQQRESGVGHSDVGRIASHKAIWISVWWDLLITQEHTGLIDIFGSMLRRMDLVTVKERGHLQAYAELGIKASYLDQGCPSWIPVCDRSNARFDCLVIGNRMEHYTDRFCDAMALRDAGFSVGWAGTGGALPLGIADVPWVHPSHFHHLVGMAHLVLSVDQRNDIEGYTSDRLWLAMGSGACVLKRKSPGLPDAPYVEYRSHEQLMNEAKRLLGSKPDIERIGRGAREWVMKNATVEQRAVDLLKLAEQIGNSGTPGRTPRPGACSELLTVTA